MLRPRFFPDRRATVFFRDFARNIFTPDARCAVVFIMALFWLWLAATPQLAPLRGLAALYANLFSPSAGRPFFLWRFALLFSPELHGRFYVKIRAPETTQFTPLTSSLRFAHCFLHGCCEAVFGRKKVPVKNKICPWKFSFFWAWKSFFGREENQKFAREKQLRTWKKWKKPKNTHVKISFCPWKKRKIGKKRLSRPLFFSRQKKTLVFGMIT